MRRKRDTTVLLITLWAAFVGIRIGAADPASQHPSTMQATPPEAPEGFFAYATGATEIQLYWIYVDDPTLRHNIYRSTKPDFELSRDTLIARSIVTPSYDDKAVLPGTTYYYRITAVRDGIESLPSRQDSDTSFKPDQTATTSPSSGPALITPRGK